MSFHVGQKVAFVGWPTDDWAQRFCTFGGPNSEFTVGERFTVAAVYDYGRDRIALDLVERPFVEIPGYLIGYVARGFRPVIERKTDISVFTEIARDITEHKPVKIGEDA